MKKPKKTLYRVPVRKASRSIIVDIANVPDRVMKAILEAGRKSLKALDRWALTQVKRERQASAKWDDQQISRALAYARVRLEKEEDHDSKQKKAKSTPTVRVLRKP